MANKVFRTVPKGPNVIIWLGCRFFMRGPLLVRTIEHLSDLGAESMLFTKKPVLAIARGGQPLSWKCIRRLLPVVISLLWQVLAPGQATAGLFYVHNFGSSTSLHLANPDTGAKTLIGNMGVSNITDLALAPNGQLYAATLSGLYSVNKSTAAATLIGSFGATTQMVGLDFTPGGNLYGVEQVTNGRVFQINTSTGAATSLFATTFNYVGDVAHSGGNRFYATATGPGSANILIEIDIGAPSAISRGAIVTGVQVPGLDFDSDGRLIGFGLNGNTYHIPNPATSGAAVLLNNIGVATAGATSSVTAVPEPASIVLLTVASLGLLGASRKRRAIRQEIC